MQNQNPLDPLDTNQFTQQLVEFAGVQQQLNTNDQLTTLVSLQQTAQSTQALTFVGKTAVVNGNTAALTNSSATWQLNVPTNSNVNITIANSSGQTVFSGTYPVNAGNNQPFTWNGQGNDGTQWPDGKYTLTATAADSSGTSVGRHHPDPGRGQFGRSHPVAAAVVDQRPDLHGQPDPEHHQLASSRRYHFIHSLARPGVLSTPGQSRCRHFQGDSY